MKERIERERAWFRSFQQLIFGIVGVLLIVVLPVWYFVIGVAGWMTMRIDKRLKEEDVWCPTYAQPRG